MSNILGVNYFFEHPSCCLIQNGKLVYAAEEERFTRIKHGKKYSPYTLTPPIEAIYSTLEHCDITLKDVDIIATSYDPKVHLKSIKGTLTGKRLSSLREELSAYSTAKNFKKSLSEGYLIPSRYKSRMKPDDFSKIKFEHWPHHDSHAASAYAFSDFSESLVFVSDGSGENACTSTYIFKESGYEKINEVSLPNSLGFFYSFITEHLGFEPFSDEYKVMGLAAYGEDVYKTQMEELVSTSPDGNYSVDLKKLKNLEKLLGAKRIRGKEKITPHHKNIAHSCQKHLESVLIFHMEHAIKKTGIKNISLAGGTFLNILANDKIYNLADVEEVFVQPASHDAGTALGAAALSYTKMSSNPKIEWQDLFLGNQYTNLEIKEFLNHAKIPFTFYSDQDKKLSDLANFLNNGDIVGLFRNRMEFGPRSLGNRSFIASPVQAETRTRLNNIKNREQFRPLAPLIPEELFEKYFVGKPNRYMMYAVKARDHVAEKMPAVVHADGTSRSQTIAKNEDEFLHSLLHRFNELSGVPVLINTSLNSRGKPIDCSVFDAISTFYTTDMDYILLEDCLVSKNSLDE